MVASEIRETWTVRHGGVLGLLVLDVSNDDGLCAVSGELESHVLAYAVCTFGDNGHLALELIVWRCGVCSFSIEGGARILCEKRKKKSIKEVRGERKPNKKHYFGFSICVRTVANLQWYEYKCQIFATFKTSAVRCFFGVWCAKCAKYLAFGTSTVDALRVSVELLKAFKLGF